MTFEQVAVWDGSTQMSQRPEIGPNYNMVTCGVPPKVQEQLKKTLLVLVRQLRDSM